MQFARFWASTEVDVPDRFGEPGRVRVWGASNDDEKTALGAARERAERLLAFFRDPAAASDYEYFNGFIREEIIEEVQDGAGESLAVITRNHYGALVLNTERVLFGDIDVPAEGAVARLLNRLGRRPRDKTWHLEKIRAFQRDHKSYVFVVYETRAGLRFAITNREMRPADETLSTLFRPLGVDRLYTRLCRTQSCFRARLTPKPWRLGLPRPASRFPRADEGEQSAFDAWLHDYDRGSAGHCAAKRLAEIGHGRMPDPVRRVLELHDRTACRDAAGLA